MPDAASKKAEEAEATEKKPAKKTTKAAKSAEAAKTTKTAKTAAAGSKSKKKTTKKKAASKAAGAKKKTAKKTEKSLRVRQVRSGIRHPWRMRRTLTALGLKHHQDEVVLPDNPSVRGMLKRVHHLVSVTPEDTNG